MSSQELLVILIGLACIAIVLVLIYLSKKKKASSESREDNIDSFIGVEDIDALAEYNKMNAASESKRVELAKQYAGRRVMWNVTYDSIVKIDDATMLMMGLHLYLLFQELKRRQFYLANLKI